jgi:hypothetical protein
MNWPELVRDYARFDQAVNEAAKKYSTGRSRRCCYRFRRITSAADCG